MAHQFQNNAFANNADYSEVLKQSGVEVISNQQKDPVLADIEHLCLHAKLEKQRQGD